MNHPFAATSTPTSLFGLGSVALAGLVGGPLAAGYLVVRNALALRLQRVQVLAFAFYSAASIAWFWVLFHVPRDALSELAAHVPQLLIWWLFSFFLLRRQHSAHAASGGVFRSGWVGLGVGIAIAVGLRVLLRGVFPAVA